MKYEMNCEFCGVKFETSRSDTKFCSGNCRTKNGNEKKKEEEQVKVEEAVLLEGEDERTSALEKQIAEQEELLEIFQLNWKNRDDRYKSLDRRIDRLKLRIKLTEFYKITNQNERERIYNAYR